MRTDEEFQETLRHVSVHETGHAVAAWHFGIGAVPRLSLDADGDFAEQPVCEREAAGTPFQQSVVGWSGAIGEGVTGCQSPWMDEELPWRLTEENIEAWHWTMLHNFDRLSIGDQQHIQAFFDPLKSCRFAFKILSENLTELVRLSTELSAHTLAARQSILTARLKAELAAEARRWDGVPRPANFPTDAEQFTALLCGGDKGHFQKFLEHRALFHLTNQISADEAEIRASFNGTFDKAMAMALTLQRDLYGIFTSGEAWLSAVQHYRRFEAGLTVNKL